MRIVCIAMHDDGLNGRLPVAMEVSHDGSNKPGETYEQFEVRMAYHEAVLPPNYPVPALPYVVEHTKWRIFVWLYGRYAKSWRYSHD